MNPEAEGRENKLREFQEDFIKSYFRNYPFEGMDRWINPFFEAHRIIKLGEKFFEYFEESKKHPLDAQFADYQQETSVEDLVVLADMEVIRFGGLVDKDEWLNSTSRGHIVDLRFWINVRHVLRAARIVERRGE